MANSTLSQAILSAGGTKFSRANTSNIELIRLNNNGSASLRKFSYNPGLGASEENNPILLNGDVVRVRRNNYSKLIDPLSTITAPVKDALSIYTLLNLLD